MGDYFTRISRIIDTESKFKYIFSIRPYTMSAQYLSMICSSISKFYNDRIAINFLTGYISDYEKSLGGILTEINDYSSNVERSNYMLDYAKEFKKITKTDFFISTTNKTVFDACTENEFSMIMPYIRYKSDWAKIDRQKVVVVMAPVFESPELVDWQCDNNNQCRHPEGEPCMDLDFFTRAAFLDFLDECKKNDVHGILLQESEYRVEQYDKILSVIDEYKALRDR